MKRFIFIISTFLFISSTFAQQTDVTFKVTNYSVNGVNYDDLALDGDVALSFYMCDDNTLCFANIWRNADSQSYGGVYALKEREIPETNSTHPATEYKFTWNFFNTYDSNRGKAAVTFTNIYIGNTVKFNAEIVVMETNEILSFQGYLED
jgi:hypothetical protein